MKLKIYILCIFIINILFIIGCSDTVKIHEDNDETKETIEVVKESISKTEISEDEAINIIKDYLLSNGYYVPSNIEVDSMNGDNYLIHAYDVITNKDESHIATSGWFEVNIHTGEIKDIMNQ